MHTGAGRMGVELPEFLKRTLSELKKDVDEKSGLYGLGYATTGALQQVSPYSPSVYFQR